MVGWLCRVGWHRWRVRPGLYARQVRGAPAWTGRQLVVVRVCAVCGEERW